MQSYFRSSLGILFICATYGRSYQYVPKDLKEMDTAMEKLVARDSILDTSPIDFSSKIDQAARLKPKLFYLSFLPTFISCLINKEKAIIDGYFAIAQGETFIPRAFVSIGDVAWIKKLRTKLEFPKIRHNYKFFLNPAVFNQYFNLHPNRTATLTRQIRQAGKTAYVKK